VAERKADSVGLILEALRGPRQAATDATW